MEEMEYKIRLAEIKAEAKEQIDALNTEFAMSNAKYKVGDIIEGAMGRILVQEVYMGIRYLSDVPEAKYKGPKLRKDNTPFKSGEWEVMYETNVMGTETAKLVG